MKQEKINNNMTCVKQKFNKVMKKKPKTKQGY